MARVFLAEDLKHGRQVAIKVMLPEIAAALGTERFLREIQIAARLVHPHILPLHDSGDIGGLLYYVMPYVAGESLRERLEREKQLPLGDALGIVRDVAGALDYAHRHGVVHRDIKPDNILISGGETLVADFGIARALESSGPKTLTRTGVMIGTPAYLSPEQAAGGDGADARSDLYSLGCVLFESLAGRAPFVGPTPESVIYQHIGAEPPSVCALRPGVPPAVDRVIRRALAKIPADRFSSAREFIAALDAASGPEAADVTSPATALSRSTGRRPLATWIAGLAVVLGAVVLAIVGSRLARHDSGASDDAMHAIAVLPLENYSGDRSQDYLAEGMTEELITELSAIGSLRVISRTSSMALRGQQRSLGEIGKLLGVEAVVEGSVARQGDRVRITTDLMRVHPERHLWGERFDREFRNVFDIQSEVAQAVTHQIAAQLTPAEKTRLTRTREVSPEAHEAYLRGRYDLERWSETLYRRAVSEFESSLQADPSYAPAWGGLADAYYFMSNVVLAPGEAIPKARAAAEHAIVLDAGLGSAHATLGMISGQFDWRWSDAQQELRQALTLSPSDATAHLYYATILAETGQERLSTLEYRTTRALDPLSEYVATVWCQPEYLFGHYDDVAARCRALIQVDSTYSPAHCLLGMCLVQQGKVRDGIRELRAAATLESNPFAVAQLGFALGRDGRRDEAREIEARLDSMATRTHVSAYDRALVHVGLGETDQAFEWLERSLANRDEDLCAIQVDPCLKPLRGDPRFHSLLRRMHLES
jgi:eukaryotic-like serine/threonine-protein kinase